MEQEVKHFQENMVLIRKSIGWTAADLGRALDLPRQTINNLECVPPRTELTKERYMAIRALLSQEIESHPEETKILKLLLFYCVDDYDNHTEEERNTIIRKAKTLVPSVVSKELTREEANVEWSELIAVAAAFALGVLVGRVSYDNFAWLKKSSSQIANKTINSVSKNIK